MDSRMDKRVQQKKKKSWLRRIAFVLVAFIFVMLGLGYMEYQKGLSQAKTDKPEDTYDFNGIPDPSGSTNILLIGVDSRGEEDSRSDTIMIAQYDHDDNTPKLVSIMRDSYVDIPGHGKNKINAAYFYGGPELLRQTIKENFDIDIEYYAIVDFKGFEKMVDIIAPEGVPVNVEKKMEKNIGVTLEPGQQNLNGQELLGYARFRHDAESDFGRVRRQQEVIGKLKDELVSFSGVTQLPELAGTLKGYVDTNMETTRMLSVGKDFVFKKAEDIESLRIPVEGGFTETRVSHAGAVLQLDMEKNRQALKEFLE